MCFPCVFHLPTTAPPQCGKGIGTQGPFTTANIEAPLWNHRMAIGMKGGPHPGSVFQIMAAFFQHMGSRMGTVAMPVSVNVTSMMRWQGFVELE